MITAVWECRLCDVQGRSLHDSEIVCWNCDGPVIVTARPAINIVDV
ncbi:hypothetical protein [Catellatospora sp. NPDC049609]